MFPLISDQKFEISIPLEVIEAARGRQISHFTGHQELNNVDSSKPHKVTLKKTPQ